MKYNFLLMVFVFVSQTAFGQWERERLQKPFEPADDTANVVRKSSMNYHLNIGNEVSFMNGRASSVFWISPNLSYDLSSKTTLRMGLTYAADLLGSKTFSKSEMDLSPRKNRNTQAGGFYLRGEHQINNRLDVAATIFYENGMPTWCSYPFLSNEERVGVSAEMRYKVTENAAMFLRISFSQSQYVGDDLTIPSPRIGNPINGFQMGAPSMFNSFCW